MEQLIDVIPWCATPALTTNQYYGRKTFERISLVFVEKLLFLIWHWLPRSGTKLVWCHFFCGPYIRTIPRSPSPDTSMRDQFYLETQIFIHHNLVQHETLTWQPCHLLLEISYTIVWQEGREASLFIGLHCSYSFVVCPSSAHFLRNI